MAAFAPQRVCARDVYKDLVVHFRIGFHLKPVQNNHLAYGRWSAGLGDGDDLCPCSGCQALILRWLLFGGCESGACGGSTAYHGVTLFLKEVWPGNWAQIDILPLQFTLCLCGSSKLMPCSVVWSCSHQYKWNNRTAFSSAGWVSRMFVVLYEGSD